MYFGDMSEGGLYHCIFEIVDNSIGEALAGYYHTIKVYINIDGSCTVEDYGRGIPVESFEKEHIKFLVVCMVLV